MDDNDSKYLFWNFYLIHSDWVDKTLNDIENWVRQKVMEGDVVKDRNIVIINKN